MTVVKDDTGAQNVKLVNGRLRLTGVQQLMMLRVLEDSLRLSDARCTPFCYTHEFRKELYDDIISQQDNTLL